MTNKRIVTGIMLALAAWGVYLAIGSTGYFVEASLMDARKSLIVALCMTAFLGLWWYVLRSVSRRGTNPQPSAGATDIHATASVATEPRTPATKSTWSKPGICSLSLMLLAIVLWLIAIQSFDVVSRKTTTVFGWSVAGLVMGAAVSGIIALANPRQLKGKWLGACGLLQFLVALVVFFVRMTP